MRYVWTAIVVAIFVGCAEPAPCEGCALIEPMDARGVSAAGTPELAAAVARLEAADMYDHGCDDADIRYVFVPRAEWQRDWSPRLGILGKTIPREYGWLSLVWHDEGTAVPSEILEHEYMHALLWCIGAPGADNRNHVGAWWDGIR
jgi:hypothetical protein